MRDTILSAYFLIPHEGSGAYAVEKQLQEWPSTCLPIHQFLTGAIELVAGFPELLVIVNSNPVNSPRLGRGPNSFGLKRTSRAECPLSTSYLLQSCRKSLQEIAGHSRAVTKS